MPCYEDQFKYGAIGQSIHTYILYLFTQIFLQTDNAIEQQEIASSWARIDIIAFIQASKFRVLVNCKVCYTETLEAHTFHANGLCQCHEHVGAGHRCGPLGLGSLLCPESTLPARLYNAAFRQRPKSDFYHRSFDNLKAIGVDVRFVIRWGVVAFKELTEYTCLVNSHGTLRGRMFCYPLDERLRLFHTRSVFESAEQF